MNKIQIPYKLISSDISEQAAGFAPFTRGYYTHDFKVSISTEEISDFDFIVNTLSSEVLIELFQNLISQGDLKPSYLIFLNYDLSDADLIIITKTLRTILSLVSLLKTQNASFSKFIFITEVSNSEIIFKRFQYIQHAQIDILHTNSTGSLLLENYKSISSPVDAFYGSIFLEKGVESLFNLIWPNISAYFSKHA